MYNEFFCLEEVLLLQPLTWGRARGRAFLNGLLLWAVVPPNARSHLGFSLTNTTATALNLCSITSKMPTRSGKAFSPTPDPRPAAQTKRSSRRVFAPQQGRTTRASKKRTRADSDASLIELESEPKPAEARPIKRSRRRATRKSKAIDSESLKVIDSARDESNANRQTSHQRITEVMQDQHHTDTEPTKSKDVRRETSKKAKRGVLAALPDDTDVQSLWQIDLVGAPPDPSMLTSFDVSKQHKQEDPAASPDYNEMQPLWQVDLVGGPPHSSTLIAPLNVKQDTQATRATIPHNTGIQLIQRLWEVDLVGERPRLSTPGRFMDYESTPQEDDEPLHVVPADRRSIQRQKALPPPPARIMFTYLEARNIMYGAGRNPASQNVPPYTLSTGERVPYPVIESYHLGAMGRYIKTPAQRAPGSAVDPAKYVFDWGTHQGSRIYDVPRAYIASLLSSPNLNKILDRKQGLLEALKSRVPNDPRLAGPPSSGGARTLPIRTFVQAPRQASKGSAQIIAPQHGFHFSDSNRDQRPVLPVQNSSNSSLGRQSHTAEQGRYILTFGPFRGKAITEASLAWLRSLEKNQQVLNAHPSLSQAFARHFPRGIFQYEVENYRLSEGPYELKRLNEVPDSYIYELEQDWNKVGESVVLQRALKLRNRELGWSNVLLDEAIRKYHRKQKQSSSQSKFMRS